MSAALAAHDRVLERLAGAGAASFASLKPGFFDRRLQIRLRATRTADVAAYAERLDHDPAETAKLRSAVAVGVTSFFRDLDAWRSLAARLRHAGPRSVAAWSAGCSTGEEAWSLAFLLADWLGPAGDWRVDGSDIEPDRLTTARDGRYRAAAAEPAARFGAVVPAAGWFEVPEAFRARVRFGVGDLVGPAPGGPYDVVLCRNVLMYFDGAAQDRILAGAVAALRPGGLLMLGKAEFPPPAWHDRLGVVDRIARIYRRTG